MIRPRTTTLRSAVVGAAVALGGLGLAGTAAAQPAPVDPPGGILLPTVPTPGTPDLSGLHPSGISLPFTIPTLPAGQNPNGDIPGLDYHHIPAPPIGAPPAVGKKIADASSRLTQAEKAIEDHLLPHR